MPDNPRFLNSLRRALGKQIRVYSALDQPSEAIRRRGTHRSRRGDPHELYAVACVLSLSVRLPPWGRGAILADDAVRTLRQAIAAGWDDAALSCRDSDLDPLRGRDDFRRLLAELLDRGFPADPFVR